MEDPVGQVGQWEDDGDEQGESAAFRGIHRIMRVCEAERGVLGSRGFSDGDIGVAPHNVSMLALELSSRYLIFPICR